MRIKKFFPVISILLIFSFFLVTQMLLTGQGSNASRFKENKKLYTAFESEFSKSTLKTTTGETLKLKDIKSPIVLLNFWASWCRPCLSEFGSLNKLVEKYGDKLRVIGINNDTEDAKKKIAKIEQRYKLTFPSVPDEEGVNASRFNITKVPASIVFYKGKVIHFSNEEHDFMDKEFLKVINKNIN